MKERLILFIIIAGLSASLYIYQYHFNTVWGLAFLITCMFIYCIYMIVADKHKKRKLQKNPKIINENYKPFVTIMVPAHNEGSVIEGTIENILQLDYPNYEVIVIDDRSTDNTADVIRGLEQKFDKVKAFIRPTDAFPGKSAVLNDAMQFANGEAILVFDADARIDSDFLTKIIPNLEPEDVGAVQARKVISNRDVNFLTRCQDNEMTLDTHFQIGRDAVKGAVELRGNGELIKRTALEDIGGWNNYTLVDDLDMSTRLHIKGWDVRFCPDVEVREEAVVYLKALYRQRRRWYEGTIRRYLELFGDVLTSKKISLRTVYRFCQQLFHISSDFICNLLWVGSVINIKLKCRVYRSVIVNCLCIINSTISICCRNNISRIVSYCTSHSLKFSRSYSCPHTL